MIGSIEAVENVRQVLGRDPDSLVLDDEQRSTVKLVPLQSDRDGVS